MASFPVPISHQEALSTFPETGSEGKERPRSHPVGLPPPRGSSQLEMRLLYTQQIPLLGLPMRRDLRSTLLSEKTGRGIVSAVGHILNTQKQHYLFMSCICVEVGNHELDQHQVSKSC